MVVNCSERGLPSLQLSHCVSLGKRTRRVLRMFGFTGMTAIAGAFTSLFPEFAQAAPRSAPVRQKDLPWLLRDIQEEHVASTGEIEEYKNYLYAQVNALTGVHGPRHHNSLMIVVTITSKGDRIVRSAVSLGARHTVAYYFRLDQDDRVVQSSLQVWRNDAGSQTSELQSFGAGVATLGKVQQEAGDGYCPNPEIYCAKIRSWDCIYTACGSYSWPCGWALGASWPVAIACLLVTCAWGVNTCCTSWKLVCNG